MINCIVAVDRNWGIGKNNDLLFNLKEDMKFFREKTKDKIIRVSTRMCLEYGYTASTVKMVCDELEISKGNYTFYFSGCQVV